MKLEIWQKADEWLLKAEQLLIVLGLLTIMGAGMLNIALRLLGYPEIVLTSILLKRLTLWLGLLGAMAATASSEHLNVDAFGRLLKKRGFDINKVVIGLICVAFSGLFTYFAFCFFFFQSKQLATANIGGGRFAWLWIVIFPISFLVMTLRYLFQTIEYGGVLFSPSLPETAAPSDAEAPLSETSDDDVAMDAADGEEKAQ